MEDNEIKKLQNDILFEVQGVGQIKNINGYDVYVKSEQCDDCLKNIFRFLQRDGNTFPLVRLTLGEWGFLKNDLIPIMIFHK